MKKHILLIIAVVFYSLLYVATSYPGSCLEDCQKITDLDTTLRKNRDYVYGVTRCTVYAGSDTLCVYVKDTTGINWNLLADTTCILATSKGLLRQKVFILKSATYPPDTLARKTCL